MSVYGRIEAILLEGYSFVDVEGISQIKSIADALECELVVFFVFDNSYKTIENAESLTKYYKLLKEEYKTTSDYWSELYFKIFKKIGVEKFTLFIQFESAIINSKTPLSLSYGGDKFIVQEGGDLTTLDSKNINENTRTLITWLKENGYISAIEYSAEYIANGNIIEENDFVIVGRNEILKRSFLKSVFEKEKAEKDILYVGPECCEDHIFYHPSFYFYHIDLYLMYVGKIKGKHHFLIAEILDEIIAMNKGIGQYENLMIVQTQLKLEKQRLENAGYDVTTVPLLYYGTSLYPYLNGLVEIVSDDKKSIYLPSYKFDDTILETLNKKYLEDFKTKAKNLGFKTILTADFTTQIDQLGALHCAVNILRRSKSKT